MTLPPFQRVLDEHGPAVHRYLLAVAGADAEDCFQDTVVAALRAYDGLAHTGQLRAWLFTIASRKAIDAHRSRGRRAVPVADVPERGAEDPAPGVDGEAEVWDRVRRLPAKQQQAVVLRYVADLSHAEIGAVMETSPEAARRNVHEGVKRLREELT